MTKRFSNWTATIAVVGALTGSAPVNASDGIVYVGRASAHDEPTAATGGQDATIVLHVVNYAALSRDVLDVAMARVAIVYERIGVRIAWVEGERSGGQRPDGRLYLSILLLPRDMAKRKISAERIKDGVLGQAHQPSGRAAIFCDRIATMPGAPTYFPIPLGDVIAHEMGHLLLGANSHSTSGIMRAYTNVHALHLQSFDNTQARTIHKTLTDLTADATAR